MYDVPCTLQHLGPHFPGFLQVPEHRFFILIFTCSHTHLSSVTLYLSPPASCPVSLEELQARLP